MPDWMDRLIAKAEEDGIGVRQTPSGGWVFTYGDQTIVVGGTPQDRAGWQALIGALREMGMKLPDDS